MAIQGCLKFVENLVKDAVSFIATQESHLTKEYMLTKLPVDVLEETAVEDSANSNSDWETDEESDDGIDCQSEHTKSPSAGDFVDGFASSSLD